MANVPIPHTPYGDPEGWPLHPAPDDCMDPQPIPVTLGTERHQIMCARCEYRSPIVADRRSARQGFDAEHGSAL